MNVLNRGTAELFTATRKYYTYATITTTILFSIYYLFWPILRVVDVSGFLEVTCGNFGR